MTRPAYAVVMAGGSGTRFWPASRARTPKQFLRITSDRTLLEETVERVLAVVPDERVYVVVGRHHAETARGLLARTGARVVVEPAARNTTACIGLAALHALRDGGDGPLLVLPADHFVADPAEFAATLDAAAEVARGGALVTLGVPPTRPETGYGYVEVGPEAGEALGRRYFRVERFVEKPDLETALGYLRGGRHRWNSGVFAFAASAFLDEVGRCLPAMREGLDAIGAAIGTPDEARVLDERYPSLESISVDYGVMERATRPIYMLDAAFGWSDVGSWEALYELRRSEADAGGNLVLGDAVAVDARDNLVYSTAGRLVALLGVSGLVVADTPDALLVAAVERSQEVRRLTERLEALGRSDLG